MRRQELLLAGIVFAVALLLYCWTLAPTVTLVYSGELILTAHSLGVAHPPGFPLYVVLAHFASLLPFGNVAVRVNFASAFFAALAAAMLALVVAALMRQLPAREPKRGKKKKASTEPEPLLHVVAPALGGGLLFAVSRTLWSYATIAEVYSLNTFLVLTLIWLMLRWRERRNERVVYVAAFLFGLALGVHHVTVALILPAFAVLVWRTAGWRFFASKQLLFAALISFAGLCLVYTYLPIAAARDPLLNWGNPRTLREIWWHITGRQYQAFFEFTPAMLGQQLAGFAALVLRQFGPWWMPLALACAIAGAVFAFKRERDRTAFWFLLTVALVDVAYGAAYDIAEDKDAYYLPSFVALAILAGFGMRWLQEMTRRPAAGLIAIVLPALALAGNWPYNNRRHYFIAHDYVQNIQRTIAPNALLMTFDWQVVAPMLYTREIEGERRDIKLVDVNLLRRSWYFDYLRRAYPDLIERSREPVESFLRELRAWEADPEAFRKSARLSQRIENAFHELLQSFVRQESGVAPVYITYDAMFLTAGSDRKFTNWLLANWQVEPRGLVFELVRDRVFHDPGELQLQLRVLVDGRFRFEKDDVVRQKVLPAYTQMLTHRGLYLAFYNQHERAIAAYEQALALDPNFKPAQEALAASRAKLGR